MSTNANLSYTPDQYNVGDADDRPWGRWEVTAVSTENGEQVVEKMITVSPGAILSLQSHKLRREEWRVVEGAIEVTCDEDIFAVEAGNTVHIPLGAKHRMANRGSVPAKVHEIQRGTCREDDIIRYEDAYGRT